MRPTRLSDPETGRQVDPPSDAFTVCKEERFDASISR
jgi:hypothetical protein